MLINYAKDYSMVDEPASGSNYLSLEKLEELLIYFSTSINHLNTEEEIAWDLVKNCIARLNFADCVIYVVDPERRVLVQKAAHGPKNPRDFDIMKPMDIPLGSGICGSVGLTGVAEIIPDTNKDPRYIVDDERRLSEIAVPIIVDGEVMGVIDCEHPGKNFFTHQHLQLLQAIASFYGIRISKLRSERREERERNKLLAAEKGMAKMRLQMLNTQLGPHFLFNSLNAIQHFIITDDKKPALNYLSLFSKLIRHFLNNIDKESTSVAEETEMLHLYLQLQQLRYSSRFQYYVSISPNELAATTFIPPLLIQSLVENFLEMMIVQNRGRSEISIQFTIVRDSVTFETTIKVVEDGQFTNHIPEYRNGLAQWSDHVDTYNRIKKYNITYSIEDGVLQDGKLASKKVTLSLPNIAVWQKQSTLL
jgi:putative methionine-R-sulfoxide reductase with GAF domain